MDQVTRACKAHTTSVSKNELKWGSWLTYIGDAYDWHGVVERRALAAGLSRWTTRILT
jgi:hypothetical protein